MEENTLTPPDLKQCQAMVPNGNTFMTFGGIPGHVQCENRPKVIITEVEPNPDDGLVGSMSLCAHCLEKAYETLGHDFFTVKVIE